MTPLSDFFPRIMPYLPGCSEPLAAQALLDSAIAFCETSEVIRRSLGSYAVVAGRQTYELDTPFEQQIVRVLDVTVGGDHLHGVAAEELQYVKTTEATPTAFYGAQDGDTFAVSLLPTPDSAYTMQVTAALRPARGATQVDSDLYYRWADGVIAGAIARIMSVQGQPFSDPINARSFALTASRAAVAARIEGNFGQVRATMRVRAQPFA